MNKPDLAALPLPRDEGGPVFAEPWEAQAFALAVRLSEQGHFIWKEWAAALADELKAAVDRGRIVQPRVNFHNRTSWEFRRALQRVGRIRPSGGDLDPTVTSQAHGGPEQPPPQERVMAAMAQL